MTEEHIEYRSIAAAISVFMLFLAIPRLPYAYYIFLRWVVSATALFSAWAAYECRRKPWVFVMGGIAILFNPIIPVHLSKETWIVIDFTAAIVFLASIFLIKPERAVKRSRVEDLEKLTKERDQAFLECCRRGMSDEELAEEFDIRIEGVKELKQKLGTNNTKSNSQD